MIHYSNLWRPPVTNLFWAAVALAVLACSLAHCLLHAHELHYSDEQYLVVAVILLLYVPYSLLVLLYKRRELRLYLRNQRRRKLNFNTKLGMNSPY